MTPTCYNLAGAPLPVAHHHHDAVEAGGCVILTGFERDRTAMTACHAGRFPADRRPTSTRADVTGLARGKGVVIDMIAVRS